MKLGTKSLLFGAHAFWLHPWFVAWAWWKLYGFPWDPRLWVAFIIHDWGYWGLDKMDDSKGEYHPLWAARVMHRLFDRPIRMRVGPGTWSFKDRISYHEFDCPESFRLVIESWEWYYEVLLHSRFLSRQLNREPSQLCYADKLAIAFTPWWLYLPMVRLTGEIREYQRAVKHVEDIGFAFNGNSRHEDRQWYFALQKRMIAFVESHEKTQESGVLSNF
jgi:hypothetical protein